MTLDHLDKDRKINRVEEISSEERCTLLIGD